MNLLREILLFDAGFQSLAGSYLPEVPVDRQSDRMTLGLL